MAAPPAAAATIVENATLAAEALDLDEADTRRLIGAQLRLTEGEADSTELTSPEEGAPPVDGMRWKLGEKMTIYNVRAQTLDTVVLPDGVAIEIDSFNRRVVTENFIRPNAIFTRDEVERLISDPRLLEDRRVLYAVKGLAGLRHGEAARLRFTHYDPTLEPLGALDLEQTKTQVPRRVPVHPTLARMLAEWKLAGWERTFGRAPRPDDLIVPTRNMTERQSPESQNAFLLDLATLGLRPRHGHDLRRTFITLAQVDGARRDLLETITHGPRGDIINVYTTFPWPALCEEVRKLTLTLREGQLLAGVRGPCYRAC